MATRLLIGCLLVIGFTTSLAGQVTSDVKDIQVAKQKLQIGTDATKFLSALVQTISAASTHNQSPTAKAVYDYIQAYTLAGDVTGTPGATVVEAIQGNPVNAATPPNKHTVLRWNGTQWFPNGLNLYDMVTTSQAVDEEYNEVWVDDIGAGITLNLPACNSANDGVKIEIMKAGADAYPVTIEPAGSELFMDGATQKVLYSTGTGISCTCNSRTTGYWLFKNM